MDLTIIVTDYLPEAAPDDTTDFFRFTAVVKGDRKTRRGGTGPTEADALVWLFKQFPTSQHERLRAARIERVAYLVDEVR